ncbi:MAG: molybdopterin-dependent oxidoreductase [Calditerrivibrio sp.]|nr:molybdopterin-dependent oxidoreductase [Calditerrivibrio sp.]
MVTLKIDGIEVQVEPNSTILDAAEKAGVHIPVLCHDKILKPFGACRVCLVEVKNNPKLMTACTTPVANGMEVITTSEKLAKIRKTLIELLLINHPLECPVCDKGGECMLQDLTYEFGVNQVRFDPKPNDTPVDHTNPFIERDIDRCVLCGRCVRICDEVVNIQAISFQNRGTDTIIGTAFNQPWNCEFCGQCMSVCPVGSLNNRVYLFKNRPWNLEKTETICGFCSCGCSIVVDSEDNEVFRITEKYELGVNKGLLCVKGRFGFEAFNSVKREKVAKIKSGDDYKDISNEEAYKITSEKLKEIKDKFGGDSIAFIVSPRITNEEAYLLQKFAREVLGTNYIYSSESANCLPEGTYSDVESADDITVLNIDLTESNPILGLFVRMTARKNEGGLRVFYPKYTALKRVASEFYTGKPSELYQLMEDFVKAIEGESNRCSSVAQKLIFANAPVLIYNPYSVVDVSLVSRIKKALPKIKLIPCKLKNNSQGIVDMGCAEGVLPGIKRTVVPKLEDLMSNNKIKALVIVGENIVHNPDYYRVLGFLSKTDFIMVTDPYFTETAKLANVYIPVSSFVEKEGTFTNLEGRVQRLQKAVDKGVVSDAEVFSQVSRCMGVVLPSDIEELQKLIKKDVELYRDVDFDGGLVKYPYVIDRTDDCGFKMSGEGAFELYQSSLRFHSGTYTTWSPDLSKAYSDTLLEINPEDAKGLNLSEGDYVSVKCGDIMKRFRVEFEKYMPKGVVALPKNYIGVESIFAKGEYLRVDLVKHEG